MTLVRRKILSSRKMRGQGEQATRMDLPAHAYRYSMLSISEYTSLYVVRTVEKIGKIESNVVSNTEMATHCVPSR
jgi:hypothetical protein